MTLFSHEHEDPEPQCLVKTTTAEPTPPVPPRRILDQCSLDFFTDDSSGMMAIEFGFRQGATWGYEQAIPEREELAQLLMELGQEVEEEADALCSGENIHPETESHAGDLRELRNRARAAAERLRGGGQ
jgi:hypothetical protein